MQQQQPQILARDTGLPLDSNSVNSAICGTGACHSRRRHSPGTSSPAQATRPIFVFFEGGWGGWVHTREEEEEGEEASGHGRHPPLSPGPLGRAGGEGGAVGPG
ncbi:unnamed protein product [Lampetra fluviatilis]